MGEIALRGSGAELALEGRSSQDEKRLGGLVKKPHLLAATIFTLTIANILAEATSLARLGWKHINLTGDYIWRQSMQVEQRNFRPLRMPDEA